MIIVIKKNFSRHIKKKIFLSKHIIMVNLTTQELRLIAEKKNIKDYKKKCQEKSY